MGRDSSHADDPIRTLGAAGATGYQVSQLSTMINDRVYAVVNSDCQKYYAEAVKTVLNNELEKSKRETNEKLERLEQGIPPIPLRKRILSIEGYLKEQGKGYKVPPTIGIRFLPFSSSFRGLFMISLPLAPIPN